MIPTTVGTIPFLKARRQKTEWMHLKKEVRGKLLYVEFEGLGGKDTTSVGGKFKSVDVLYTQDWSKWVVNGFCMWELCELRVCITEAAGLVNQIFLNVINRNIFERITGVKPMCSDRLMSWLANRIGKNQICSTTCSYEYVPKIVQQEYKDWCYFLTYYFAAKHAN